MGRPIRSMLLTSTVIEFVPNFGGLLHFLHWGATLVTNVTSSVGEFALEVASYAAAATLLQNRQIFLRKTRKSFRPSEAFIEGP